MGCPAGGKGAGLLARARACCTRVRGSMAAGRRSSPRGRKPTETCSLLLLFNRVQLPEATRSQQFNEEPLPVAQIKESVENHRRATHDTEQITRRLGALEQSNRALRGWVALLGCLTVALAGAWMWVLLSSHGAQLDGLRHDASERSTGSGQGSASPSKQEQQGWVAEEIRAKRMVLVADDGTVRAIVGERQDRAAGLWLFDSHGRERAHVKTMASDDTFTPDSPELVLFAGDGSRTLELFSLDQPHANAVMMLSQYPDGAWSGTGVRLGFEHDRPFIRLDGPGMVPLARIPGRQP